MNKSNVFVLYHGSCTDGLGAKYAAWKTFGDEGANYIPVYYGEIPPKELNSSSEVYILDFSYPRRVLVALQGLCASVVVLDHHKTAQADLEGLEGCTFNMAKSGCVLAWEYFHPGVPVPRLLEHIQDRDLWAWKLNGTKEICKAIPSMLEDMGQWDSVCFGGEESTNFTLGYLWRSGIVICALDDLKIKSMLKRVRVVNFCGHKTGIINATEFASEIGNAICMDSSLDVELALVYNITKDNTVAVSLRSVGEFDVSVIAKKFSGGGHKNASGCSLPIETLLQILKESY